MSKMYERRSKYSEEARARSKTREPERRPWAPLLGLERLCLLVEAGLHVLLLRDPLVVGVVELELAHDLLDDVLTATQVLQAHDGVQQRLGRHALARADRQVASLLRVLDGEKRNAQNKRASKQAGRREATVSQGGWGETWRSC